MENKYQPDTLTMRKANELELKIRNVVTSFDNELSDDGLSAELRIENQDKEVVEILAAKFNVKLREPEREIDYFYCRLESANYTVYIRSKNYKCTRAVVYELIETN